MSPKQKNKNEKMQEQVVEDFFLQDLEEEKLSQDFSKPRRSLWTTIDCSQFHPTTG